MRNIFINDVGRLRSGWRVVAFILAFIAVSLVIVTVLRVGFVILIAAVPQLPYSGFIADMTYRIGLLISALVAAYLCARFLEGLPWRSLGLTLHSGWLKDLFLGYALGFVTLAIAVGIAAIGKGLTFQLHQASLMWIARSMIGSCVMFFVAALAEEAMFRGYPLQTLTRARLAWLGVLLTSVPFGLVHLNNPNVVPVVTFANTALAGVWFGVGYLRTRSLWLPWGLHWSWNWALGWFFGLPVSGINLASHPFLSGSDFGPSWLTGGSYGIEGGIAATVALILSTLFIWRAPWLSATPEMIKLTSEENPVTPEPVLSIGPVDDLRENTV